MMIGLGGLERLRDRRIDIAALLMDKAADFYPVQTCALCDLALRQHGFPV